MAAGNGNVGCFACADGVLDAKHGGSLAEIGDVGAGEPLGCAVEIGGQSVGWPGPTKIGRLSAMQYRSFPKIPDLPISTLGFGCMRLPTVGGSPAHIEEDAATRLIHQAIDAGVNYFDTAWPYAVGLHGRKAIAAASLGPGIRQRSQPPT